MKKTPPTKAKAEQLDELAPEYRFEYGKAKPNRFAKLMMTMPTGRGSSHR
jgi:hypothetical protein